MYMYINDITPCNPQVLAPDNDPLELYIAAQDGNDHGVDDDQFQLFIILQDFNDNHPSISALFPPAITVAEVSVCAWQAQPVTLPLASPGHSSRLTAADCGSH